MKTKKNICMVAYTNYLIDARVRREAETLASLTNNYKVLIFVLKEASFPKTYFKDGVEVHELNVTKYRGKSNGRYLLSYLVFLLLAFFAVNKLLREKSLDIVHVHNMPNFLVFSAIIPYLLGKKIILDIHDTVIETYATKFEGISGKIFSRLFYIEEVICCAIAHKIICVNHIQREALVKRGIPEDKIVILMNVPDPGRFKYTNRIKYRSISHSISPPLTGGGQGAGEQRGFSGESFKLVYFGTISKRLGVDLAIRAVSKLVGKIHGLEFHIVGNGDDIQEFMNLSNGLGVEKSVIFYKKVFPLEELIKILDDMDMCIVPNRKNSATELMLPVKMLESVALGIPVVVPRLKAIEYYFSDDMVTYFEPENIDSMADTILDAFNNEPKRINRSEQARLFLKKYGWDTHKYDLFNLYKALL